MYSWSILLGFSLLLILSLLERIKYFRQTYDAGDVKSSPLSLAIQELVAIAGGIYLSLVMLISFLKLDIPHKILFFQMWIDPVACIAILLSIIQPFFIRLFCKNNKG
ncbi:MULTISPECIES: hypothetical protein [Pelosinus]|uniref:Uncharacterized protein n=1 Tax=Pelosinus fermentans B4 TaxID=1149862 RepID=I8RJV7_9FIRM|nr:MULTISPECIES: hypothetical protein [Pelosinus]EIW18545.1 hypothetical protein FB4_3365 [Pelosinus fermentans B4]EIW24559.1 hypothetical protein FA11_3366 [Pelosinus fermentans A11]OAM94383.1 hypothetical protein FR7_02401 [Pelosinus fermentans DSM 17108]SDR07694.1 hypothetical protein SAMN04515679_2506 [Pelosinus fermentans]